MINYIILVFLFISTVYSYNDSVKNNKVTCIGVTSLEMAPIKLQYIPIEDNLIPAMIQVESLGDDSAIGDTNLIGNEAVGALQIRPIMVREVNRILKIKKSKKRYYKKDRFSREKSIEMFLVWKNYHHPEANHETIARNWNGGPKGYKIKGTEYYWSKIQKELISK
jgi:hypothetical protein